MSGHSKWAQIKRQKASTDAKRSASFGKFARLIAVESKKAGGDVNGPGLRATIDRARAINMPKENIDRAVAKGKEGGGAEMETIAYEMYGPGGVAIVIDALTDSRNRTNQELKHLLSEQGYALATPGSALWAFKKSPDGSREATSMVELGDEDIAKLETLVDALEIRDDVDSVTTNAA
jgi:YebC/PmpR family DNA-binding regulatory protein